jgi:O-methyltransferase involved in polyketide biosynthesis
MKNNQASFTAKMTAYMRAYHAMHDTPKIFDDFLAYCLIPGDKIALIEQCLTWDKQFNDPKRTESLSGQITLSESLMKAIKIIVSRAQYAEDTLDKAVKQGVKQYVILGLHKNLNFGALLSWDGNIQQRHTDRYQMYEHGHFVCAVVE